MTFLTGKAVGPRLCEILGLRGDRTATVSIEFPPDGPIVVHAEIYPDELEVNAITGMLESEMKQYQLVQIDELA